MERERYVKKSKRDPYLMALALTQIEDKCKYIKYKTKTRKEQMKLKYLKH